MGTEQVDMADPARAALALASRIADDALIDRLAALGIQADTMRALALVPLAAVAWADGHCDESERRVVLAAAQAVGIGAEGPGRRLLNCCLDAPPPQSLLAIWRSYVGSASAALPERELRGWRDEVVAQARRVAAASGGFNGFLPNVSENEATLLDDIARAFAV